MFYLCFFVCVQLFFKINVITAVCFQLLFLVFFFALDLEFFHEGSFLVGWSTRLMLGKAAAALLAAAVAAGAVPGAADVVAAHAAVDVPAHAAIQSWHSPALGR